jgi:hypothetical protein
MPGNEEHQHLRDSVHAYENPKRAVGFIVLADAKDAAGKFIGSNIEAGHRTVDGQHVAARPFFFPTYRAFRKSHARGAEEGRAQGGPRLLGSVTFEWRQMTTRTPSSCSFPPTTPGS